MADLRGLSLINTVVRTSSWINEGSGGATPTYEDYPYRADIAMAEITANFSADVRMNYNEIKSGIFAPVCECTTGKVMIYASEIPSNNITIPAIICTKVS